MRRISRRSLVSLVAGAVSLPAGAVLQAENQKSGDGGYGDLKEVLLEGKVVSLADEMAKKYGARIGEGSLEKQEKQWGLALPEGQLYTFLDTANYRKLLAARLANQAVEIKARLFPRSMLLEITGFRPVDPQVIKRRFFCNTCNIYFDDYGPCVCCGQEVKVLKDGG